MKTGTKGIQLIKCYEGLRLHAYQCQAGVWTIGYGHTKGVKKGDMITELKAETLLVIDLQNSEYTINKLVKVPLNPLQPLKASFPIDVTVSGITKLPLSHPHHVNA